MCSHAGCKGLRKYKKQIERDEEIAEELQDGNKSDRRCKSQYKNVGLGQYKNVGFPT